MHALLGRNQKGELLTRKTFAAGEHREVAMDTARFYAVTGKRLQDSPEILRTVAIADVQWFIEEAGPNYLARHKANGEHKSNSRGRSVRQRLRFSLPAGSSPARHVRSSGDGCAAERFY